MAEALVDRFINAYSFDNARTTVRQLRAVPSDAWTQPLADAVRQALVENNQLALAVLGPDTVPDLAETLLRDAGYP